MLIPFMEDHLQPQVVKLKTYEYLYILHFTNEFKMNSAEVPSKFIQFPACLKFTNIRPYNL